jgi:hypothetical protein
MRRPGARTRGTRAAALPFAVVSVALAGLAAAGCTPAPRQAAPASPAQAAAAASPATAQSLPAPGTAPAPAPGVLAMARLGARDGAAPRQFVAVTVTGVDLVDAATGRDLGRLLPSAWAGMSATGVSAGSDGDVWVTYGKAAYPHGPAAEIDGGVALPHSCASVVVVVRTRGAPRAFTWLRSGGEVRIGQAVPSPDGRLVAYTEQPCTSGYDGLHLRVTDLRTGKSWAIGQGLPGCHVFTAPAWSADSRQLIEGYAAANPPYYGPRVCNGPGTERLLRLDARRPQPGAAGQVSSPGGNCQVTGAAGLPGGGALALEDCGRSQDYARDFAALLPFSADGRPGPQVPLGRCTAPGQLSADPSSGDILLSARVDCDPASARSLVSTRLWTYSGGRARLAATTQGMGLWERPLAW